MIKKVYIDTSVIGGVFDVEFSHFSKLLFSEFRKGLYIPVVSPITTEELSNAPRKVKNHFEQFSDIIETVHVSEAAVELSKRYVFEGRFTPRQRTDALHIAVATANRIDVLASWNFAHIVNLNRIALYNAVNIKNGYPTIEIRNPRELIHE